MNYKSRDKIRIQVVHYVFCSAILKEKHKVINIYTWSPEHQHKLRWLDGAFQGLYLPILSNNYVAIKKDLEKITTTALLDKFVMNRVTMTSVLS